MIFRYTEAPSMPSLLYEKMLRFAKVKESQSSSKPNFHVRDYSKGLTSPAPPDHLRLRIDISRFEIEGSAIYQLTPKSGKGAGKDSQTILFFHGGSYVVNATRPHWRFLAGLVERSGFTVIAPDYPLAPEHSYADAYTMITKLYRGLAEEIPSRDIVLMGDSAGGGLALGFSMLIRDEKMPQPSTVVMLSPWLDVTMSNHYMEDIDSEDPFLNIEALRKAGFSWAHGANPRKPLISPIYGDFSGLPPLHVFTGTKDVLAADCRRLRGLCMAAHAKLAYYEFENMVHDWMLLNFKEAKMAASQIAAIVSGYSACSIA